MRGILVCVCWLVLSGGGQLAWSSLPEYVKDDQVRIRKHLDRVIRILRARNVSHLPIHLQEERKQNIATLVQYRALGVFPRNTGHKGLTPYFIDSEGRACAVGYLMMASGYREVAEQVARRENNAYVADIKTPAAHRWIQQSGLTAAECALIQPSYGGCDEQPPDPVCDTRGRTHQNRCWARWNGAEVAYGGKCRKEKADQDGGAAPEIPSSKPDTNTTKPDVVPGQPDKVVTPLPDAYPLANNTGLQCSSSSTGFPLMGFLLVALALGGALLRRKRASQ